MRIEARARLKSLVGFTNVINTKDRPPSTYMDEAEMDNSLPDGSAAPGPIGMGIGLGANERLLKTAMPDLQGYQSL